MTKMISNEMKKNVYDLYRRLANPNDYSKLPDSYYETLDDVSEEDFAQLIDVITTLLPRECKILMMRFGLEDGTQQTLETVGGHFSITRERVRQYEAKAIRKIRFNPTRKQALPVLFNMDFSS